MMRLIALAAAGVAMVLVACGPSSAPVPVLPTFLPPLSAAPNEAYPTARAAESKSSQAVSGFTVDLERAWRDGKQVHAAVCFSLPDASDWTIWAAHFDYGGEAVSEFSSSLTGTPELVTGGSGRRCDELVFYVPPDADLSSASLTIESLGAYPTADDYCSLYMPKIQDTLRGRGIDITLDCPAINGAPALTIVSKPAGMTQEEAERQVFSDEFYTVRGPWTFPVTFAP
jgi:hypothetical protein